MTAILDSDDVTPILVAFGEGDNAEHVSELLRVLRESEAPVRIETCDIGKKMFEIYGDGLPDSSWDEIKRTKAFFKPPFGEEEMHVAQSFYDALISRLGLTTVIRSFVKEDGSLLTVIHVAKATQHVMEDRYTDNVIEQRAMVDMGAYRQMLQHAKAYALANGKKTLHYVEPENASLRDRHCKQLYEAVIASQSSIDSISSPLANIVLSECDVMVVDDSHLNTLLPAISEISSPLSVSCINTHYGVFEVVEAARAEGFYDALIHMLHYVGLHDQASRIDHAVQKVDISSAENVADAIIAHLPESDGEGHINAIQQLPPDIASEKTLVGVDLSVDYKTDDPGVLAEMLQALSCEEVRLKVISRAGVKVWPGQDFVGVEHDYWQCRFVPEKGNTTITPETIIRLQEACLDTNIEVVKTEHLYFYNGELGFSLAIGE